MVAIDVRLGDAAEYFNAAELLRAWGDLVTGRGLGDRHFIAGQERLGDVAALQTGTALFVLEPLVGVALALAAAGGLRRNWQAVRPR